MISLTHVSKSFHHIHAVRDLSFEIKTGEVVGFLGPNGAGKSTTMRMITGYLTPSSGQVLIDQMDVNAEPIRCKQKVGYLPESAALYTDMEVTDYLSFVGRVRGLRGEAFLTRLKAVVAQCQLQKVLGRTIGELSKGYRQRVGLAQALLHDPQILILDEPTVGLDPNQIIEIRSLIKEIGKTKTILLSSHILQEVTATCQRVIIINEGKVVAQGTPEELAKLSTTKNTYHFTVRGDEQKIQTVFTTLPGVAQFQKNTAASGESPCVLQTETSDDFGETIFRACVQNGFVLTRLNLEKQSLEDVFQRLTTLEPPLEKRGQGEL